jgi:hypothetical protein
MTIQDLDRIDIFGVTETGAPILVIVDSGDLAPEERLAAYRAKLVLYANVIGSEVFQQEQAGWRSSKIELSTSVEPTAAMKAIQTINVGSRAEPVSVPVEWTLVAGMR